MSAFIGKSRWLAGAVIVAALSACASMDDTQRRTAVGAGVGTAAGAVIGNMTGGHNTVRGAAIGGAVGALGTYLWSRKMEEQRQVMEQATAGTGVAVTRTEDNQLRLEVPSDVSFDVGQATIKPNLAPVLDRFAQTLRDNPATTLRIVGHTDSTGSDAVNNPLSVNRAASTRQYLVDHGVAVDRIAIDGRGSHEPIADNGTESGRARNRRVEIFVGEPQSAQAPRG
ncbi:MAG: OmpA family protein [Burkholderiaceae bacterium]